MRKRRKGLKNDIIIDLTSLLDVMFIILLVVLCGQSTITEDLSEAQAKAEYAIKQAEEENEKLREYLLKGVSVLKECANPNMNLLKLINLAKFMRNTCHTVLNVKKHYIVKQKNEPKVLTLHFSDAKNKSMRV